MSEYLGGYDNWLQEPYMEEEEGCNCAGLNLKGLPCPVHDPECFGDSTDEELEA